MNLQSNIGIPQSVTHLILSQRKKKAQPSSQGYEFQIVLNYQHKHKSPCTDSMLDEI